VLAESFVGGASIRDADALNVRRSSSRVDFINDSLSFISRGGPAMIALIVCSLIVVTIVFERLMFFSTQHGDSRGLLRSISERVQMNDYVGAEKVCMHAKGMLPRVLAFGLARAQQSRSDISDALQIALLENSFALERNLAVIGTIAVIAPFVGLFGTVLGIIKAFQDIALKGNPSPAVVAAGVSEALITTAAGLFVAVVSVVFFNYFKTRIKAYNEDMTVTANLLAEMLHFRNTGVPAVPVK
jgi:biopolymer transport protein ExbB